MIPHQTRELIKKAYPGNKWADKVNRMSDQQAFAVFVRLRQKGKIK
jgi:hypothetical protein